MHPQSTQLPLSLEAEEWRPVVGYEGWYEVSSLGRVRRVAPGHGTHVGRILKSSDDSHGYPHVILSSKGYRSCKVHRLVAEAFLGPAAKQEVNHKNGIKSDNRLSNLEWVTHCRNMEHASAIALWTPPGLRGEQHGMAKLTEAQVREIRALGAAGCKKKDVTGRELARRFGVSVSTISVILTGKKWQHV